MSRAKNDKAADGYKTVQDGFKVANFSTQAA
jgi:hypothetical protein